MSTTAPGPIDPAVGPMAVALARRALEEALGDPRPDRTPELLPEPFRQPSGAFVTLRRYPDARLRGCIGYPLPILPLGTAIRRAAVAAATEDPRFRPVGFDELARLTVEVSILTVPVPVPRTPGSAISAAIQPGRDGLVVEGLGTSGLLLPQVATEMGWNAEELLDGTCEKAGLPAGAWRDERVTVRTFQAAVFFEERPGGPVHGEGKEATLGDGRPAPRR